MTEREREDRADAGANREGGPQGERPNDDRGRGAHEGGDYAPNDRTRAGHRSFENTSYAADEREQTEERERVVRGEQLDEAGEPPDPEEGRD